MEAPTEDKKMLALVKFNQGHRQVYLATNVLIDSLNIAISAKCFLGFQKEINRTAAILRTMSAFTVHWRD